MSPRTSEPASRRVTSRCAQRSVGGILSGLPWSRGRARELTPVSQIALVALTVLVVLVVLGYVTIQVR